VAPIRQLQTLLARCGCGLKCRLWWIKVFNLLFRSGIASSVTSCPAAAAIARTCNNYKGIDSLSLALRVGARASRRFRFAPVDTNHTELALTSFLSSFSLLYLVAGSGWR